MLFYSSLKFDYIHSDVILYFKYKLCLGPPDPLKTAFVRHSSTVICIAELSHSLVIEPRDEFNNLCHFRPEDDPIAGYSVHITQVIVYQKVKNCK